VKVEPRLAADGAAVEAVEPTERLPPHDCGALATWLPFEPPFEKPGEDARPVNADVPLDGAARMPCALPGTIAVEAGPRPFMPVLPLKDAARAGAAAP